MSVINSVPIRSSEYLKNRGLYDVMVNTTREIPLFYQYCKTTVTSGKLPEKNIIGYIRNIREEEGNVVCTVILDDYKTLSKNFIGVIDNYTLKTFKGNSDQDYELIRFVVYDKEFKERVDEKIYERTAGKIPRATKYK